MKDDEVEGFAGARTVVRVDSLISWLKSTCMMRIGGGACTKSQAQNSSTCPFTVNCSPFQKATGKKTCLLENKLFFTRHMCVQRRLLFHARLLKDYHLFDVPKSRFPFITNHSPFNLPWREGAWRKGHIFHLARKRALTSPLSDQLHCTITIAFRPTYTCFPDFQTTNLRSNPPLTSHSSLPPSASMIPHY